MNENIKQELLKNTRMICKDKGGIQNISEFNEFGLETYFKNMKNNFEIIKKYNERGQLIHRKDSDGFQLWIEYDELGREIYNKKEVDHDSWIKFNGVHSNSETLYEELNGFEKRFTYNGQGLLIHSISTNGKECRYKYNERGQEISKECSDGYSYYNEYDEKGRKIAYIVTKDNKSEKTIFVYNDKDLLIKSINNYETIYKYNEKGLLVSFSNPKGSVEIKYDERDREVYRKNSGSYDTENFYEYDDKDRLIHYKSSNNDETWYEYEYIK